MRKHANPQVTLKPQDLLVLMKLCVAAGDDDLSFRKLADQTGVAKSEVHAAVLRLEAANLVIRANDGLVPIRDAVREFILHGARFAFAPVRGPISRGVPTSWGAAPLNRTINQSQESPPVWPDPKGTAKGPVLHPLYPTVPEAARRDARLYELLALFDALRDGRARERELAAKLLRERLS